MDRCTASSIENGATEEAVSWFLRIQEGFSQSDFREWRRWLAESEVHAAAFDAVSKFWQETGRLDDLPWPSESELAADTYDGHGSLPLPVVSEWPNRRRDRGWQTWLAAAASIAALCMVALILSQEFSRDSIRYQTGIGEHRTVSLQDGSSITLGAKSDVLINYSRDFRRVELRTGEAYFKVAKQRGRPFIVAAGTRTVRALGTEFDINIGVRDIRVSVLEGRVRVEGPGGINADGVQGFAATTVSNLGTGDVLDFNRADSIGIVSEVDPTLTTSWLEGRLAYVGAPLESVIADVNRYSETELIIGDNETKQLIFTGTIFSDDIGNWLHGLERVFPLQLVPVQGHRILLIKSTAH